MKTTILISLSTLAIMTMAGCAVKAGNETLGKMNKAQIERSIVKGKSTKSDIKSLFGDPDKTDFDNNGNEKWTYTHVRNDAKVVNYIPVANWFVAGTNDTKKSLIVLFNDNGTVKNFINSDAKGETKGGLFQ